MEEMLQARNRPQRLFRAESEKGSVVLVDPMGQRPWVVPPHRALVHPTLRSAARTAVLWGTFAVCFRATTDTEEGVCGVAWAHAIHQPPTGVELPAPSLLEAMCRGWGMEGQILGEEWGAAPPLALLPPIQHKLRAFEEEAARVAAKEFLAGQAKARTQEGLETRAAAMLLVAEQLKELGGAGPGTLPGALYRRLVSKQTTKLLFPGAQRKPPWYALEELCEQAGWGRETKATSGFPWPQEEPKPGEFRRVKAKALYDEFVRECGEVHDNHVVYTVCKHVSGHDPVLAPHLKAAIKESLDRGQPLRMYNPDALEPSPGVRELKEHWGQVQRLVGQGTYVELSEQDILDPDKCWVISWLGTVFKGTLTLSAAEEADGEAGKHPATGQAGAGEGSPDDHPAGAAGGGLPPAPRARGRSAGAGPRSRVRGVHQSAPCATGRVGWEGLQEAGIEEGGHPEGLLYFSHL